MEYGGLPSLAPSRLTYDHYITGKAAINFPSLHATTGRWQYLAYWNSATGQAKISLLDRDAAVERIARQQCLNLLNAIEHQNIDD